MIVRAYAKINLGLRVLDKRPDGYHNIETVFHQIDLYDQLEILPGEDFDLTSSSQNIPTDASNLCVRAAELMQRHIGTRRGVSIRLTKFIPVGAGLGGGSSDAAAVLLTLNTFWNVGMTQEALMGLAATLGSDVPFFLVGGTALGTSRGEVLEPFALKMPYWIVTVTPSLHVSTAWAYSNLRQKGHRERRNLRTLVEQGMSEPRVLRDFVENDFEASVMEAFPEIRRVKDTLLARGALFAQMSGSGSSVYALFGEEAIALHALAEFRNSATCSMTAPMFRPSRSA